MAVKFLPWIFVVCYCRNNIDPKNNAYKTAITTLPVNVNQYKKIVEIRWQQDCMDIY